MAARRPNASPTRPLHVSRPRLAFSGSDYAGLHDWSIAEPEAFYSRLWDFLGIVGDKGDHAFVPGVDQIAARFFPGCVAQLYREPSRPTRQRSCGHRASGKRHAPRDESARSIHVSSRGLSQALTGAGIVPGRSRCSDCHQRYRSHRCSTLRPPRSAPSGLHARPISAPTGAADRLAQIEPKLLFAVSSYELCGQDLRHYCQHQRRGGSGRRPPDRTHW